MRTTLLLCFCLWCIRPAQAQAISKPKVKPQHDPYAAALRFNFTGLADPIDNNISLGGEFPFHPNWSLITDLAYIEYSAYFSNIKQTSGYIVKPAIRFYPYALNHSGFFEAVLFYKKAHYHLRDWLGRDCVNGIPVYEQYKDFSYNKQVTGMNLQMGLQTDLSRNKQLRFEAYLGLGIRIRKQDVAGEENWCYNLQRGFADVNGTSGTTVVSSFPIGMRIIYCIRR